mmetsp:Transcript_1707/g.6208  ORF Transcript_1707/g.6208 Transcript_1707/m.6208 type:complete len:438 (-) Transcript_1707:119-1432(-)
MHVCVKLMIGPSMPISGAPSASVLELCGEGDVVGEDVEVGRVRVLGEVKSLARAAARGHRRVVQHAAEHVALGLVPDGELAEELARGVRLEREPKPRHALLEPLERARRGVDGVVRVVRLRLEAQSVPLVEDELAERALGGAARIRRADNGAAEGGPGEDLWVEADDEELDLGAGLDKGLAHGRVEAVDDPERRLGVGLVVVVVALGAGRLALDHGHVGARRDLDLGRRGEPEILQVARGERLVVAAVGAGSAEAQRAVARVEDGAVCHGGVPGGAEGFLEGGLAVVGHDQVARVRRQRRRSNLRVVLVDQRPLRNRLAAQAALAEHHEALCRRERRLDKRAARRRVRCRFHEYERDVGPDEKVVPSARRCRRGSTRGREASAARCAPRARCLAVSAPPVGPFIRGTAPRVGPAGGPRPAEHGAGTRLETPCAPPAP